MGFVLAQIDALGAGSFFIPLRLLDDGFDVFIYKIFKNFPRRGFVLFLFKLFL